MDSKGCSLQNRPFLQLRQDGWAGDDPTPGKTARSSQHPSPPGLTGGRGGGDYLGETLPPANAPAHLCGRKACVRVLWPLWPEGLASLV